jgi:hypothetical protein
MAAGKHEAKCKPVIQNILWRISDHGRFALILGLVGGLALPGLASAMQPWLPHMVAGLLTITALRIGHRAVLGALSDLRWSLASVAILQLALPLFLLLMCTALGLAQTPMALAMVLATAAPALAGSANIALMLKQDAGRMMQLFVLGTALFPLTVLPLLIVIPQMGDPQIIVVTTVKLLAVIVLATGLGFGLRAVLLPKPSDGQIKALDGLSVFAFSAIVVGLMAALNPALRSDPGTVMLWVLLAFAISYGAQIITHLTLRRTRLASAAGPLAIGAGNRNIALFLVALPETVVAQVLVFIGCWQLPMYLTPILMRWLYKTEQGHD